MFNALKEIQDIGIYNPLKIAVEIADNLLDRMLC
jgi:hypothetical protein